ncbi:MAG: hypothetical protein KHX55_00185 [Proteobacteria bacterium]|nr:hypothetical protein [Pseudomonadota bacterium]
MDTKRITSKKAAQAAFEKEFATLACALNPASQFFSGYEFVRQKIQLNGGEPFMAYIAHDNKMENTMVVPCNGDTPTIEDFKDIHVIKAVNTPEEAKEAFIAEFGSLARVLNPASEAYMGFRFRQKTIEVDGEVFKAFMANSEDKKTTFIVPVDGTVPSIKDYKEVVLVNRKKA